MADVTYQPGSYTFKWMVDTTNVEGLRPLRIAQIAAYALQPRFGNLAGNAVQPTDAEFIKNRMTNDNLTGVIRLFLTSPQSKNAMEERILTELRANGVPDAAKHLGSTEWGAAVVLGSPITALGYGIWSGVQSLRGEQARQNYRNRNGNVIIDVKTTIDNEARPASGSGAAGTFVSGLATRVSADPARNGNIAASAAAEIAERAAEGLSPPWWLIGTLIGVGSLVLAGFGFYLYKQGKMLAS